MTRAFVRTALLALVALPGAARAQAVAANQLEAAAADERSPWGFVGIFDSAVGAGTLVEGYANNPLVSQTLSLRPNYHLDELPGKPVLVFRQDVTYEYTQPDNPLGRRFDWFDSQVQLQVPSVYRDETTGINLMLVGSTSLPISRASRLQNRITASTVTALLSRQVYGVTIVGTVQATKVFNTTTVPQASLEDDADSSGNRVLVCSQDSTACFPGAFNTSHALTGALTFAWRALEDLTVSLDLRYFAGWEYASPNDAFTSPNARSGNVRNADNSLGVIDFSYVLSPNWFLSTGLSTFQPARTADQRGFRFPFFDTQGLAGNRTSYYFDVIASF